MPGIVFAGVAPHGWPTIPDLSADAMGALRTRSALQEVGRRCAAARPDVIVVATPHGVRVEGAVCLAAVARGAGALHHEGRTIELNVPVDGRLTGEIVAVARESGIPVALAGFGGNDPAECVIPLIWGTMVPLWFTGHGRNMVGHGNVLADDPKVDEGPPVVIVTPWRGLSRQTLIDFGVAVANAANRDGRRVVFIASCDWAHAHEGGRAEFSTAAAEVDALILNALRENDLGRLIDLDEQLVEDAAIDGLWQLLMLTGAIKELTVRSEVLSYEAPPACATGMIVATFEPAF